MTTKCCIMTDSCCDLPADYLATNHVDVLNFSYTESIQEDSVRSKKAKNIPALEGIDDMFTSRSAHEFYEAMRKGAEPTTAPPSIGAYDEMFRAIIAKGVPAVYLCFSGGLSGSYKTAVMALDQIKDELGHDTEFYIVDTRLASTAQALLIMEAIRQRDKGLSAQELVSWAEEAPNYLHSIFMVDDLTSLARGGRIPSGVASVGTLLDVKPILCIALDGTLAMVGFARGRKKGIQKMAETFAKNHTDESSGNFVCLGNADCKSDMEKLEKLLTKEDDNIIIMETNIGPTIGCHVGPGMLSCVFWGTDRRSAISIADRIANTIRKE